MKISNLLCQTAIAACTVALVGCASVAGNPTTPDAGPLPTHNVKVQQIRNATIKVEYAGTTFLIDPMLAKKGAYAGFPGTYNSQLRNPLVELPIPVSDIIQADAVIVTHTHLDHWDDAAKQDLPKSMPIFAQNEEDADRIRKDGFANVRVLTEDSEFNGTHLSKTGGQHGTDEMVKGRGASLGKSSGVVFRRENYKTVYVAGDTLWNQHVDKAIKAYHPDVIVLNACYGQLTGYDGAFLMGKEDLYRGYLTAPNAKIVSSHMDTIAHCMHTRQDLRSYIAEKNMDPERVLVPEDGQTYAF